jgi:hypothetical protein
MREITLFPVLHFDFQPLDDLQMKDCLLIPLVLMLVLSSCNMMPAAFWRNYRPEFILEKNSDQGPWGGVRKIIWRSEVTNTFNSKQLIDYASQNGWQLTDSLISVNDSLKILTDYSCQDYSFSIL